MKQETKDVKSNPDLESKDQPVITGTKEHALPEPSDPAED